MLLLLPNDGVHTTSELDDSATTGELVVAVGFAAVALAIIAPLLALVMLFSRPRREDALRLGPVEAVRVREARER